MGQQGAYFYGSEIIIIVIKTKQNKTNFDNKISMITGLAKFLYYLP